MNTLATHPISQKWPAQHPDRLQLYSLPTRQWRKRFVGWVRNCAHAES